MRRFYWTATLIMFVPGLASAVNIHAVYLAACQREVGIILGVSPRQIEMLTLDGTIQVIDRYEVIYLATYPVDRVPISQVKNPSRVPMIHIQTFQNGKIENLVNGWPVDFSQDKIAFLSLTGSELVVERSSIWGVASDQESSSIQFTGRIGTPYDFAHPYAFENCPGGGRGAVRVFPQQLLSDPVAIKREFDRLSEGHNQVRAYERSQVFYPVPEVYSNHTSLGLWLMTGARYGASTNRKNNFAPLLTDETSTGPFGFQSEFRTGSGPILTTIHEETQSQIYYRMKADYFHFSALVDPNLLLVGLKYKWQHNDLSNYDVRAVESTMIEMGFDYGRVAFELYIAGGLEVGARAEDEFDRSSLSLGRFGIRYQANTWTLNAMGGSSSADKNKIDFFRTNWIYSGAKNWGLTASFINRKIDFNGESTVAPNLNVKSNMNTVALYGYLNFKKRYRVGAFAAFESGTVDYVNTNGSGSLEQNFPKIGTSISLSF